MRSDVAHIHNLSIAPVDDVRRPAWFEDESEWEYEYDENETEDFFFNLDLTTHLPDALAKRVTARNGRWARGTMEARYKKTTVKNKGKDGAVKSLTDPHAIFVDEPTPGADALRGVTEPITNDDRLDADPDDAATVQFVGLETASPYLMFNDTFYSAYWLTNLGTQLWISRPGLAKSTIYKGHILDVIGASQIPQNTVLDPTLRAHASFMERFSALKWKRGEMDQMPLHSVKMYEFPDNAQEVRDQALEALEQDDPSKARQVASTSVRFTTDTAERITDPALIRKLQRRQKRVPIQEDSDDGDLDPESDHDEDNAEPDDQDDDDEDEAPVSHTTRRPAKKKAKQNPKEQTPPKRKRRSRAEMAAARVLANAAKAKESLA